jgi:repressor LexA
MEKKMTKQLTARQAEVFDFIKDFMNLNERPPTLREIGHGLGIKSTNGVNDHLKALETKGWLTRAVGQSRGIRLSKHQSDQSSYTNPTIPLLGRVAAGSPVQADDNVIDNIPLPDSFPGIGGLPGVFALKVSGDSMIGDGIFDEDLIFVQGTSAPRQGTIMVVRIDGEVTVKRYYRDSEETLRLEPSNPDMKAIIVSEEDTTDVELVGAVIGVFRHIR